VPTSFRPGTSAEPPRSVVSRLAAILLTFRSGSSHSVTELARLTGLPVSTAHRLAGDLAGWHLLRRAGDGRYEVGAILRQLAAGTERRPVLADRASLALSDLFEATQRRARLGVLDGTGVSYIEQRTRGEPSAGFTTGANLPAHATALGKALLAFAPAQTIQGLPRHLRRYTPRTITGLDRLCQELRIVRLNGVALCQGELARGDCSLAAPVFGPGGLVAAVEVQLHDVRGDVQMCRPAVIVAARALSRELSLMDEGHAHVDPGARPRLRLMPGAGHTRSAGST
jgi:DNA-binding IclR family transcriptional regulator